MQETVAQHSGMHIGKRCVASPFLSWSNIFLAAKNQRCQAAFQLAALVIILLGGSYGCLAPHCTGMTVWDLLLFIILLRNPDPFAGIIAKHGNEVNTATHPEDQKTKMTVKNFSNKLKSMQEHLDLKVKGNLKG